MRDGLKILSTAQLSSPRFKSGLRRDSYPESVKVKYKKHRRYIRVDLSKVVEGSTCHEMDREDSQLFDAAVDPEMKP